MKRALSFLVLFGTGLALLIWIERSRRIEPPIDRPAQSAFDEPLRGGDRAPVVDDPSQDEPSVPIPIRPEGRQSAIQVEIEGWFEMTKKERGGPDDPSEYPTYRVGATFDHVGEGVFLGRGAVAAFFRPRSADERFRLESDSVRTRIETESVQPKFDEQYAVRFEDVRVTTSDDEWAFAPFELQVPDLVGTLAEERFLSDGLVQLSGRGITGSGTGIELAPDGFVLLRDVVIDFVLPQEASGQLRSDGSLQLLRFAELGPDGVIVIATGGAEFDFQDETENVLQGETIRFAGLLDRSDADEEATFVPSWIEATDGASLEYAGSTFQADEGRVGFHADGSPNLATLFGSPTVDLPLAPIDPSSLPIDLPDAIGGELRVQASGVGPLVVEVGGDGGFDFTGPVDVDLPSLGAHLTAKQYLRGLRVQRSGTIEQLNAAGDVLARFEDSIVSTRELEVLGPSLQGGRDNVRFRAEGPTRVRTTTEDGRPVALRARGATTLETRGEDFVVRRAEGVEVTIGDAETGDRVTIARADLVENVDSRTLTFEAKGNVAIDDPRGRASAERMTAAGEQRLKMFGTDERPVRWVLPEGTLEAAIVETRPDLLVAGGGATAKIQLEGRTYDLQARSINVERQPRDVSKTWETLTFQAEGGVELQGRSEDERIDLAARWLEVQVRRAPPPGAEEEELGEIDPHSLTARGGVVVTWRSDFNVEASGDHLVMTHLGAGVLTGTEDERVQATGSLPREGLTFDLTADRVDFTPGSLSAQNPDMHIDGAEVPMGPLTAPGSSSRFRATSGHVSCDRHGILFTDDALLTRRGPEGELWSLEAGRVALNLQPSTEEEPVAPPSPVLQAPGRLQNLLAELVAWQGFTARFGAGVLASGDHFVAESVGGRVTIKGRPAVVQTPAFVGESDWLDWNTETGLLRANGGRVYSQAADATGDEWSMEFTSLEPRSEDDTSIQIVRDPLIKRGDTMIRADWAVFWVDPDEWRRFSRREVTGEVESGPEFVVPENVDRPFEARQMPSLLGPLMGSDLTNWMQEAYVEGNIEYFVGNQRVSRASETYLDAVDGHGWIRDVEIRQPLPYVSGDHELVIRVAWMRHSRDGSLQADDAKITTCSFAQPHYRIESGDLRLTPRPPVRGTKPFWELRFRDNAIVFGESFAIPLPDSFAIPLDRTGNLHLEEAPETIRNLEDAAEVTAGNARRVGTFMRARFIQDLGWVGRGLHELIGGDPDNLEGKIKFDVGLLGSRGGLLGVRPELEEAGLYFLRLNFDTVYDTGEDRGLVRVDEGDRLDLRSWIHLRGRYWWGEKTWLDIVGTNQTDAGVQSEFWESELLTFEQRENFLHFRTADGTNFFHARARNRPNSFRSEVEELPEVGFYHGRTKLADVGPVPLHYSTQTDVGYYRRAFEGSPTGDPFDSQDPFAQLPTDGIGSSDVVRADTWHRVEAPFALGVGGIQVDPFLEARGTIWSEDVNANDEPYDAGLFGGVELSTLIWKPFTNGWRHEILPSIGYRTDLVHERVDGQPVVLDEVETPREGHFVDLGLRQRVVSPDGQNHLDVEVKTTWAEGLASQAPIGIAVADGWMPMVVNANAFSELLSVPLALHHDARYDFESGRTDYSRTLFGFEPFDPLGIEVAYNSARRRNGTSLYNVVSGAVRYRATRKWEFEGRGSFTTDGDSRLASSLTVRRYGHDLILEIDISDVAGEGAAFSFSLKPVIGWRDRGLGLLAARREGAF